MALARHEQHVGKIHASWSRAIGLSSRRLARRTRYAPNDRLLKSIVVAIVDDRMQFDEFLAEVKRRYGIVIGDAEGARLVDEKQVDQEELSENRDNLEARLVGLGLVRRLSDSCSFVENPFAIKGEERMLTDRIIGRVGADILAKRITDAARPTASPGLGGACSASTSFLGADCGGGAGDPRQSRSRSPGRSDDSRGLGRGPGLAAEALIPHNAGYVRNNAETAKEAILTANGNEHNLADTLGHVMALGAKEMRANEDAWVEATCHVGGHRARAGRPADVLARP